MTDEEKEELISRVIAAAELHRLFELNRDGWPKWLTIGNLVIEVKVIPDMDPKAVISYRVELQFDFWNVLKLWHPHRKVSWKCIDLGPRALDVLRRHMVLEDLARVSE